MLIPSIDLQGGRIVQLIQGEKLAIEATDSEVWISKFIGFPRVQLIDLDAAKGQGDNAAMVADICRRLPCRVGGGIRSIERARAVLDQGAHAVIASSALFRNGNVDVSFAEALSAAIGAEHVIAAVDSRGGHVAIHGWRTVLPISTVDAVRMLEPFCGEFLYTALRPGTTSIGSTRRAWTPSWGWPSTPASSLLTVTPSSVIITPSSAMALRQLA